MNELDEVIDLVQRVDLLSVNFVFLDEGINEFRVLQISGNAFAALAKFGDFKAFSLANDDDLKGIC
jgi:hypothetical protein